MLPHYASHLPEKIPAGGYAEPFAGGAAMFAHLRERNGHFPVVLGDVNREIMGLYEEVRDNPERLIHNAHDYSQEWAMATGEERRELYYATRARYWAEPEGPVATAMLYCLMRTGFNGIWQTCQDSNGRYGTPVGLVTKNGPVLDMPTIREWSRMLSGGVLHKGGYGSIPVKDESFVFCDPPYRDSFTTYSTTFGDEEQKELIMRCRKLHHDKGCSVWLSNRDADDGFFEEHAPDATLVRFPVTYTAGRRKKTDDGFIAKQATELLMKWE